MAKFDYDELMLNCLRVCEFNKKQALDMFRANFPKEEYERMRTYSYVVYERVVEKVGNNREMGTLIGEMLVNLRKAGSATLEMGLRDGHWEPFKAITEMQMKAANVDKPQLNQNNFVLSMPPEKVREEIANLRSQLSINAGAIGVSGVIETQGTPANQSTLGIPAAQ